MKWIVLTFVTFVLLLSACANINSSDINTSGICADISVSNDASNNVYVSTKLTAGCGLSASYVSLNSGDSLVANYLGTDSTLIKHTDLTNNISYTVNTNQSYANNGLIYVKLNRTSGNVSAPNSFVTLPTSFTISSPTNGRSYANGDTITITQNNYDSLDNVEFSLNCMLSDSSGFTWGSNQNPTNGASYSITVSALGSRIWSSTSPTLTSCSGTMKVVRSASGYADPNLDSGSTVHAKYSASVSNISITF